MRWSLSGSQLNEEYLLLLRLKEVTRKELMKLTQGDNL
jgi:hypothetical protein